MKKENYSIYKNSIYIYFLNIAIGSCGLLFGFNNSIFNILSTSYLDTQFEIIDTKEVSDIQGNLILIYTIGGMFGCLFCSYIINTIGRRKSWILFSLINFFNSFLYWIPNLNVIYLAQFIVGFFVGIYLGVSNGIVLEFIPSEFRNFGIQTFNFCFFGSIFITFAFGYLFENYLRKFWYIFIWGNAFIEFFRLIFILIFMKFESPNYLYRHMNDENNEKILKYFKYIYKENEVEKEYNKFVVEMEDLIKLNGKINVEDLVFGKNRKGFLFASFMNFFQQSVGITLITFFSIKLFNKISNDPYFWNIFIGLSVFLSCLLNLFLKKLNRKKMIIFGSILLNIIMISMVIANYYNFNLYVIICLFIYIFIYAICFGGIYFEYLSKINEPEGMLWSGSFRWMSSAIFSKLTPYFLDIIDIQGTLIVFISFLTIFIIIFIGFSIDINNKNKIEIKMELKKKKFFK